MSEDLSAEEEAAYEAELAVAERLIAKAIVPYEKLLTAAQRAQFREDLLEVLMTHPNANPLIAHLAKRPAPDVSGEVGEDAARGPQAELDAAAGSRKK